MSESIWRRCSAEEFRLSRVGPVEPEALAAARSVIAGVRARGADAVLEQAFRFGERAPGEPLVVGRPEMEAAAAAIPAGDLALLERTAGRIRAFAEAQLATVRPLDAPAPGGRAGHTIEPMERAGCYAPGGRYPLPSSALMTVVPARVAGCATVVMASPNPGPLMLAAAWAGGADAVLGVGGAHAIAGLAYGLPGLDPVDIIAGPGNKHVTAAKMAVSGDVAIDMLAGPSELVVLADDSADPAVVAADLLAQAEHDVDASAILVATDGDLIGAVERELRAQLADLPTAPVASASLLANGAGVLAGSLDEAVAAVDRIAPEHLEVITRDAGGVAERIRHAGAVFIGPRTAEAAGDYGVGPNHTLPTGGAARRTAGLSVFTFLRLRTFIELNGVDAALASDVVRLARLEGLEAHARSMEARSASAPR